MLEYVGQYIKILSLKGNIMTVLVDIFKEEKERLVKMQKFYMEKISGLPRGSIVYKRRGKKEYPYLMQRDGRIVRTDYLKINEEELKKLDLNIKKRKKYLKLLKEIEKDLKILSKIRNE